MNERIKKLRKALDLTQQKFADRLGLKQNTIATYEMGRSAPSDPAIKSICREFHVNEAWLRTGQGDMFVQKSRSDEIAAFMDRLAHDEPDDIWRRFVSSVSKLNTEELRILEKVAINLVGELPKPDSSAPTAKPLAAELDSDGLTKSQRAKLDREVEAYQQRRIAELRAGKTDMEVSEELDLSERVAALEREKREMAAKIAALEEEDAEQGEFAETEEKLSTFAEEGKMLA